MYNRQFIAIGGIGAWQKKAQTNRKEKTSHRIRYGSLIVMLAVLILGIVYLHGMVQRSEEKAPASQSETPGAGQEKTILESIEDLKAGQILDAASLDLNDPDKYFTSSQLTEEQKEDMKGKSYIVTRIFLTTTCLVLRSFTL